MKGRFDKLVIVGNGFDRWQELPTSYDGFRKYYFEHIGDIARSIGCKVMKDSSGNVITPVELIFGDIFTPGVLPNEFFWNFESSMSLLDDQRIALYFGKTDKGAFQMQEMLHTAMDILSKAFGDWIASISIEKKDAGYLFGDDCYFINFNYTDTLEKRFGVDDSRLYYMHGDFSDPESIIFGHSKHPEIALPELMEQKFIHRLGGGKSRRLRELYLVEDALYETDKHVLDNIDDMCEFMTIDGLHIEDITDIYVLGHSFGEPDYEYFSFLVKATQLGVDVNKLSALWKFQKSGLLDINEDELFELIRLNIIYASRHRQREFQKEDIPFPKAEKLEKLLFGRRNISAERQKRADEIEMRRAKEAVRKRFIMEQAIRTKEVIDELCILKSVDTLPADCCSVLATADYIDGGHDKRTQNAKWHISYFSENDRKQIEEVMRRTKCQNYELYHGIDECIRGFKK